MHTIIGVMGPGTTSEVALAIKTGKPVVLLNLSPGDKQFFQNLAGYALGVATTAESAVNLVQQYLSSDFR
jgi:hypothetical protein